jgi:hypothetical protein
MASCRVSIVLDQEAVERFSHLLYGDPVASAVGDADDRATPLRGAIATGVHCPPPDGGTKPPKKEREDREAPQDDEEPQREHERGDDYDE